MVNHKEAEKYIRRKKRKKFAAIFLSICSTAITIFIIIAFCVIQKDRFTVTVDESPSLCLAVDEEKQTLVTKLTAPPLLKATDTQYRDIPENIDDGLGSKNTYSYFAYSFYLGGQSDQENINYSLAFELSEADRNLEDAIVIMIIRNGEKKFYSKENEDGTPKDILDAENRHDEPSKIYTALPFKENRHIILEPYSIKPGNFDKYTIVMWIDGWYSNNDMRGGTFQANMKFSTLSVV